MKPLKIVVVGDGAVGKTCLCITYTEGVFPVEYVPTIFDNYSALCNFEEFSYNLSLWDTAGQEEYDRLRPLSYPSTDVYLICFSVVNRISYNNVKIKWFPEVRHHSPHAAIVLVGTKVDLRNGSKKSEGIDNADAASISYAEGFALARDIEAAKYMECSAMRKDGVNLLFEAAVKAVSEKPEKLVKKRKCLLF